MRKPPRFGPGDQTLGTGTPGAFGLILPGSHKRTDEILCDPVGSFATASLTQVAMAKVLTAETLASFARFTLRFQVAPCLPGRPRFDRSSLRALSERCNTDSFPSVEFLRVFVSIVAIHRFD